MSRRQPLRPRELCAAPTRCRRCAASSPIPATPKRSARALAAIAMMPEMRDRDLFLRELGVERRQTSALPRPRVWGESAIEPTSRRSKSLEWRRQDGASPGHGFCAADGRQPHLAEDAPFRYLINTLNSAAYHDVAYAYLVEAARQKPVLQALYGQIDPGTEGRKNLPRARTRRQRRCEFRTVSR